MSRTKNLARVTPLEKVWLSKTELAAYLGVSERYVLENINTNPKVDIYRLSNKAYIYNRQNIDDLIRSSKI